jgi:hypothetical protein
MFAQPLSVHPKPESVVECMKVRCDRDYALFLKSRYHDRFFVEWHNGIMTLTRPMMELTCICEE